MTFGSWKLTMSNCCLSCRGGKRSTPRGLYLHFIRSWDHCRGVRVAYWVTGAIGALLPPCPIDGLYYTRSKEYSNGISIWETVLCMHPPARASIRHRIWYWMAWQCAFFISLQQVRIPLQNCPEYINSVYQTPYIKFGGDWARRGCDIWGYRLRVHGRLRCTHSNLSSKNRFMGEMETASLNVAAEAIF